MCHLFNLGRSPATIATKVSALAFWHKVFDKPDPVDHFLVKRTLMGMRKRKPQHDMRPQLSKVGLHKMVSAIKALGGEFFPVAAVQNLMARRRSSRGNLFCFKDGAYFHYSLMGWCSFLLYLFCLGGGFVPTLSKNNW